MFYKFKQNNSGGGFDVNDKVSIAVWIEADSKEEACAKAEEIGIYFDGVEKGEDCSCCGDRWSEPWEESEEPTTSNYDSFWVQKGTPHTYIYYKNGKKEWWVEE
jgi:hypothetical protein